MPVSARLPRHAAFGLILAPLLVLGACTRPNIDAPPKSVVFFTDFSGQLGDNAKAAIDQFSKDARVNPTVPVLVEGYADSAGSTAANQTLSKLRAQVVADALVERGVARTRITLRPRGSTSGEPGVESRRVELELGR